MLGVRTVKGTPIAVATPEPLLTHLQAGLAPRRVLLHPCPTPGAHSPEGQPS